MTVFTSKQTYSFYIFLAFIFVCLIGSCAKDDASNLSTNDTGVGGSFARFMIVDNYLYIVDEGNLKTIDISEAHSPSLASSIALGDGIETIFNFKNHLFIGSQNQMFIYGLDNPAQPNLISSRDHLFERFCVSDPVVANAKNAFVTLHREETSTGEDDCFWVESNVLDIYNIENIDDPQLINTIELSYPLGLGLLDSTLYLCQGEFGLTVFNISNTENLLEVQHISDINVRDIIPLKSQNLLLVIGPDNLYQFDASDPHNIQLLSTLDIVNF